ncbi:MAG: hypothetical protein R3B84_07010 [Zavarzinella sp.]
MMNRRNFLGLAAYSCLPWQLTGDTVRRLKVPATAATKGPKHHFFGYYDKCPWNQSGQYLLAMENDFIDRQPEPSEKLTVGMVDLKDNFKYIPLDTTPAWCWQQGTMLQWLGSDAENKVIYNAVEDGTYVSEIRDVTTGRTSTLPRPIYAVSGDGKQAVSLPFDRLHRLRPGYGYCALKEKYPDDPAPKDDGIWWLDIPTGKTKLLYNINQISRHQPDDRMRGAMHWVNHLQFNPKGDWFIFLHRWKLFEKGWQTRLYVGKTDGSEIRLLLDDGMTSHFDWRDDRTILAWAKTKKDGNHFYLIDIESKETTILGGDVLKQDGHCSYSPDRKWILNDTYPDKDRLQWLMLYEVATGKRIDLNQFFLPKTLTGPFRCDLHPRWNRDGKQVCIDSGHADTRQIYLLDVAEIVEN